GPGRLRVRRAPPAVREVLRRRLLHRAQPRLPRDAVERVPRHRRRPDVHLRRPAYVKQRALWSVVFLLLALCACSTAFDSPGSVERKELAPTGTLRFGVVAGAVKTEYFVVTKPDGELNGVTVDLA